jgi:murein L,D-transpeptidase YcbB/YkuD
MRRPGRVAASFAVCAVVLASMPAFGAPGYRPDVVERLHQDAVAAALERTLSTGQASKDLVAFYRARDNRPMWIQPGGAVRPEVSELLRVFSLAAEDGLNPGDYQSPKLRSAMVAGRGGVGADVNVELLLTQALIDYLGDLRTPRAGTEMVYTDPALEAPSLSPLLREAAQAPDLAAYVRDLRKMNPVYERLRQGLADYRMRWMELPAVPVPAGGVLGPGDRGPRVEALRARLGLSPGSFDRELAQAVSAFQRAHGLGGDGRADAATVTALNTSPEVYERLIIANLNRVRGLPLDPGRRFILVDAAAARLWLYEDGRPTDSMRVVVGSREFPTPEMAGLVRYVIFNPYWNLPPDLTRERIAKRVVRDGVSILEAQDLEVLSDWSADATLLDPADVDWPAVASGRQLLRVRQRPGPGNTMGAMKFMLPNQLGIYLHDTPDKALFGARQRTFSAGCVRVENPSQLARWLLAGAEPATPPAGHEKRVDLPSPVPIYITYLTASPGLDEPVFRKDVYGRDQRLLAQM